MKKLIVAFTFAIPAFSAQASYIVDTGFALDLGAARNYSFDSSQYFGAKITTTEAYKINTIEGNIWAFLPGIVTVSINVDANGVPGNALFSKNVAVEVKPFECTRDYGCWTPTAVSWEGAQNVDYRLNPGTYWVTFLPDQHLHGVMPGMAAVPLADYVLGSTPFWSPWDRLIQSGNAYWRDPKFYPFLSESLHIPLRIDADVISESSVPEPSTLALFGAAAAGLFCRRNRNRS